MFNRDASQKEKNAQAFKILEDSGTQITYDVGSKANADRNTEVREQGGAASLNNPSLQNGDIHCPDCGARAQFFSTMESYITSVENGEKLISKCDPSRQELIEKYQPLKTTNMFDNGGNLKSRLYLPEGYNEIAPDNGMRTEMWECGESPLWLFPVYVKMQTVNKPNAKKIIKTENGYVEIECTPNNLESSNY
jgi:hypothetical protein